MIIRAERRSRTWGTKAVLGSGVFSTPTAFRKAGPDVDWEPSPLDVVDEMIAWRKSMRRTSSMTSGAATAGS